MNKFYIIFGLIGSVCFLVGDILLGSVDSTPLEKRSHFYLTKGHGRTYDRKRIKITMTLAAVGVPFLYMGMAHIWAWHTLVILPTIVCGNKFFRSYSL